MTSSSHFKIVEKFKKITIYQKLSIISIETNSMFVNATNVKNQKNVFIISTAFKLNKSTKVNFVIKSELKRLTININKSNSKIILSRKKRDKLRKIKSNNEIKNTRIF